MLRLCTWSCMQATQSYSLVPHPPAASILLSISSPGCFRLNNLSTYPAYARYPISSHLPVACVVFPGKWDRLSLVSGVHADRGDGCKSRGRTVARPAEALRPMYRDDGPEARPQDRHTGYSGERDGNLHGLRVGNGVKGIV